MKKFHVQDKFPEDTPSDSFNVYDCLFKERPKNKKSEWADEMDRYRKDDIRVEMRENPLAWWKNNERRFPLIGIYD